MRGTAIHCLYCYPAYYYRQDIASSDLNFPKEKCVNYLEISEKSVNTHTHNSSRVLYEIFSNNQAVSKFIIFFFAVPYLRRESKYCLSLFLGA